jgi:tetratricopeptide (TPR) repeat protein
VKPLQPLDIKTQLADLHLHSPDYVDAGMQEFQDILKQQPDNQAALRGLGYAYLRKHDFKQAGEYFDKAVQADSNEPRVLYYSAVLAQQEGGMNSNPEHLTKVQKQLEKSISLDPDFADSYSVLAFILMSEGKPDEAVPAMTKAISLNPRNEQYSLNLAQLYLMQRKYDESITLLRQLSKSSQPQMIMAAERLLESVQSMKEASADGRGVQFRVRRDSSTENVDGPAASMPVAPATDAPATVVPVAFMKGKLVSVDCTDPKAAELTMLLGTATWKLHVKDRAHALVIGADAFSCAWINQKIAINYRKTGNASGDVVSIEME